MSVHLLTGEAVPIVPFAFDAVLGLVTLATLLVFLVCLGLREGWDHTIGYGLRWIAGEIDDVAIDVGVWTVRPFGFVADVFRSVDHHISHALAVAALNTENAAASLWHMTASVFWWTVHETKNISVDTFHALEHAVTVTVPDAAKWAWRESVGHADTITHEEAALRRAADARIGRLAHVAEADALHGLRAAEHALDWSESQVGALGRELGGLKARLEQIARQLSPAAIVALIGATIFTDFGLGWLRCSQVGQLGRSICGLPSQLFNDLLALLADVVFVASICELLPLIEETYAALGTPLVDAVTDAALEVCAPPKTWPADLPVPHLYLPAVQFDGTLHLAA